MLSSWLQEKSLEMISRFFFEQKRGRLFVGTTFSRYLRFSTSGEAIGKTSIGKVRDAFAEIVKRIMNNQISQMSLATHDPILLVHIHDTADMRMRSLPASKSDESIQIPKYALGTRARYSKIENHKVELVSGGEKWPYYTELTPLVRKDSATIGTSIIQILRDVACSVPFASDALERKTLVHIVVGDGIFTNAKALRCTCLPNRKH